MSLWTRESIQQALAKELGNPRVIAVSNREPYSHIRSGSAIECVQPASGLVSAVDPIMQASGGVWIAQGSGEGIARR